MKLATPPRVTAKDIDKLVEMEALEAPSEKKGKKIFGFPKPKPIPQMTPACEAGNHGGCVGIVSIGPKVDQVNWCKDTCHD